MISAVLLKGDGIGPEVIDATTQILAAAGAPIAWVEAPAGARVFEAGDASGIPRETMALIESIKLVLKGPLETPIGFGAKSANVTLRKTFETYGNIRPVKTIPGIKTPFSDRHIDFVVVRENIEDLYAGMEYMQSAEVAEALKITTRLGCAKIARLAFDYARWTGRRKVTCATKANILKLTEGLMKQVFEEIAQDYSDIQADHVLVDNCAHLMVKTPEIFDVVVMTNMNGDILSDLASGLVGGLGVAAGMNMGRDVAIFEAVHGTAPNIAGQNKANPMATLFSALLLLRHVGLDTLATHIEKAVTKTLEHDQIFPLDIAPNGQGVSTRDFTAAVIRNVQENTSLPHIQDGRPAFEPTAVHLSPHSPQKTLVGVDIFIEAHPPLATLEALARAATEGLSVTLEAISNRGLCLTPLKGPLPDVVNIWGCRFMTTQDALSEHDIHALLSRVEENWTWVETHKLFLLDGTPAFSALQGA